MDKAHDHGIIKAALSLDTGRHLHQFMYSDLPDLELTFIRDFALNLLEKAPGPKSAEKTPKLEAGISKRSTC